VSKHLVSCFVDSFCFIRYEKIYQCKKSIVLEDLCDGLPTEFLSYMRYCRSLSYEEVPNYSSLRKLFRDLWVLREFKFEECFQWVRVVQQQEQQPQQNGHTEQQKKGPATVAGLESQPLEQKSSCAVVVDARVPVATKFVMKKK
jgi:hypothetical protein